MMHLVRDTTDGLLEGRGEPAHFECGEAAVARHAVSRRASNA